MFDPSLGERMSFVGFVRPGIGSVPPCAEMQARYLALVLSGERPLPVPAEMEAAIRHQAASDLEQFPVDAERLPTLTDYLRFMDDLADRIGCRPELGRLWLRDLLAAAKVLWGPLCGAQFRLTGPGADPARMRRWLRRLDTMPWPVLAYELAFLVGSRLNDAVRGRRRSRP
jgi:dimethylaniline monooxygenase (N-oxide forming)